MAGSSIFDYVHQKDHQELSEQLGLVAPSGNGTPADMPSPGSASDEGSTTTTTTNNNNTSRSQTPPIPERGEHYCKSSILKDLGTLYIQKIFLCKPCYHQFRTVSNTYADYKHRLCKCSSFYGYSCTRRCSWQSHVS